MTPGKTSIWLILLLFTFSCAAQISTGTTTIGANGGSSMLAPCTEILRFDNYNDNVASGPNGQNFVFILNNGDSLYFNLQRTGNPINAVGAPANPATSFGRYGYTGLAGLPDLYQTENIAGDVTTLAFSNIVLNDHTGKPVPDFSIIAYDCESTGYWESLTFTVPSPWVWNFYDSISPSSGNFSAPTATGVGTNTVNWVGPYPQTYPAIFSDDGFSLSAPTSFLVTLANNGSGAGLQGVAIGINRRIIGTNDTLCTGGNIIINPLNAPAGTMYTWGTPVVNPPGSVTGATAQSTPVDNITQTLAYTGTGISTVIYTITPVACNTPDSPFTATVVFGDGGAVSPIFLGNDTSYCGSFSRVLSTGIASTLWSTGVIAPQITVTRPGTYWARDSSSCGVASDTINISIDSIGPVMLTAHPDTICSNDSSQVCAPDGYRTYQWNVGGSASCIEVNSAGTYYVTVSDNDGCTAQSEPIAIWVYPVPSVSVIIKGDTLYSYDAVTYQWLLNDSIIPGATSPMYIAKAPGLYSLYITDTSGCNEVSQEFAITGIDNLTEGPAVMIYPNPNSVGNWQLVVGSELIGSELDVYDDEGRLIFQSEIRNQKSEIAISGLPNGVYFLRISSMQGRVVRKLVKL